MDNKSLGLCIKNLSFGYIKENQIIRDVNLNVQQGQIIALIGANGCGKSTLFNLLTGRLKPSTGKISLNGEDIRNIKRQEFAKRVAAVHQYNTAPDDITVRKLVSTGRTPYQRLFSFGQGKEDKEAVDYALEITDTAKYSNRMLSQLSGGQKQRVWLAMALAQSAEILLLDEITTYLDIRYQVEILSLIQKLNKEHNLTVLMVLHDINQALQFSNISVVMKDGKILNKGETSKVITKEILDEAFHINTTVEILNNQKYCIFNNREER